MAILITGGTGYIGSHTIVELLQNSYDVVVIDNLSNSKKEVLKRINKITNRDLRFYNVDLLNTEKLEEIFTTNNIESVIHLAGLKAVGESLKMPLQYYENNITGTINLLKVMNKFNCKKIIFSSSATVYGIPERIPLDEECRLSATNPYGRTKLFIENILKDLFISDGEWSIVILRYFNPIGAHPSGLIGEDPKGIPNNLIPYITQTIIGKHEFVKVWGNDYQTPDGTGIRDYIHVCDLAHGHVCALKKSKDRGFFIYNLGTGKGYSVLEIIQAFSEIIGRTIPYKIFPRRNGDIAISFTNPNKANKELNFIAARDLNKMCQDHWNWQITNPNGY